MPPRSRIIRIATRSSQMALHQAELVADALESLGNGIGQGHHCRRPVDG
jgi:porphobilinogen deaminase